MSEQRDGVSSDGKRSEYKVESLYRTRYRDIIRVTIVNTSHELELGWRNGTSRKSTRFIAVCNRRKLDSSQPSCEKFQTHTLVTEFGSLFSFSSFFFSLCL